MPTHASFALRRRPHMERHVLAILRQFPFKSPVGDSLPTDQAQPIRVMPEENSRAFRYLSLQLQQHSLALQAVGVPYVGRDEQRVLGWLAEAQRVGGAAMLTMLAPPLREAIIRCAAILEAMGHHLPASTIYGGRTI